MVTLAERGRIGNHPVKALIDIGMSTDMLMPAIILQGGYAHHAYRGAHLIYCVVGLVIQHLCPPILVAVDVNGGNVIWSIKGPGGGEDVKIFTQRQRCIRIEQVKSILHLFTEYPQEQACSV